MIALGYGLRRSGFIAEAFWPQAERLCYFVLLPALFLNSLATADLDALPVQELALVPTVNLLCILVFARFGTARVAALGVLRLIVTNPLVVACLGGILLQWLGMRPPAGIEPALRALGAASMPLGLLCVGAALDFGAARSWIGPVIASSVAKFLVMPMVTLLAVRLTGLGAPAATIALMFQALPTASSSYILARQLGGDAPLMAGITATQTVLAACTIPAVLALSALVP